MNLPCLTRAFVIFIIGILFLILDFHGLEVCFHLPAYKPVCVPFNSCRAIAKKCSTVELYIAKHRRPKINLKILESSNWKLVSKKNPTGLSGR
jgi:hypothetical protein